MPQTPNRHVYETIQIVWVIERANWTINATFRLDEETETEKQDNKRFHHRVAAPSLNPLSLNLVLCRSYRGVMPVKFGFKHIYWFVQADRRITPFPIRKSTAYRTSLACDAIILNLVHVVGLTNQMTVLYVYYLFRQTTAIIDNSKIST